MLHKWSNFLHWQPPFAALSAWWCAKSTKARISCHGCGWFLLAATWGPYRWASAARWSRTSQKCSGSFRRSHSSRSGGRQPRGLSIVNKSEFIIAGIFDANHRLGAFARTWIPRSIRWPKAIGLLRSRNSWRLANSSNWQKLLHYATVPFFCQWDLLSNYFGVYKWVFLIAGLFCNHQAWRICCT
jgi:hypothetical protein